MRGKATVTAVFMALALTLAPAASASNGHGHGRHHQGGGSAIDQYSENLPAPGGNKPTLGVSPGGGGGGNLPPGTAAA